MSEKLIMEHEKVYTQNFSSLKKRKNPTVHQKHTEIYALMHVI